MTVEQEGIPTTNTSTPTSTIITSSSTKVDNETLADARGRMGVFSGEIEGDYPTGSDGVMVYIAPPPSLPPPPPSTTASPTSPATGGTESMARNLVATMSPENHVVKYKGEWWQGHWHGKGMCHFLNGDIYEGSLCFSQRHGTGTYRWSDGRLYTGQWQSDSREGFGRYVWPGGSYYEGNFANNRRHGRGIYKDPKLGVCYEGSFVDGVYQGEGIYQWTYADMEYRYSGTFVNGKPHGSGKEENLTTREIRHDGLWRYGEPARHLVPETLPLAVLATRVAETTIAANMPPQRDTIVVQNHTWTDHETGWVAIYRGLWDTKAEVPNGNGTAEFVDLRSGEGWKSYEGCFVAGRFHGRGRLLFLNGDSFEGDFADGFRHGKGSYRWHDGRVYWRVRS